MPPSDADKVKALLSVAARLENMDKSLRIMASLVKSIRGDVRTVAADSRINTQLLATMCERQARTQADFTELKALIIQQSKLSQQQTATTDRLVRIVETLVEQQATQPSSERSEARSKFLSSWTERTVKEDYND